MKIALLLLMLGCVIAPCLRARSIATDGANPPQSTKPPAPSGNRRATANKRAHAVPLPRPMSAHRPTKNLKGFAASKGKNHEVQTSQSRNAAKYGAVNASRAAVSAHATRLRPGAAVPSNTRHPSSNAAAIGGPKTSTVAALDGRAVSRRR
jgi:hypothetical protein